MILGQVPYSRVTRQYFTQAHDSGLVRLQNFSDSSFSGQLQRRADLLPDGSSRRRAAAPEGRCFGMASNSSRLSAVAAVACWLFGNSDRTGEFG